MLSQARPDSSRLAPLAWAAVLALAAVQILIHLLTNGRFGIFRDELYYLACANHLAWGYVDHPPLSVAVLAATKAVLGDGVSAIRIPVVLSGGAVVLTGAMLARELGGGRFAQILAALCLCITPTVLVQGSMHSMNAFELLFWLLAALLLARMLRTGSDRLWPWLGLVIGLGLMNKISMGVFATAMVGGLLLTSHRRRLARPRFWLAPAVAAVVFLPYVLWQIATGWPTLEFMANAQQYKITATAPLAYLAENALEAHPFNLLVWLPGLLWLLFARGQRYRPLGWIYLLSLGLMLAQRSKPYYLAPAYLILIAAGAVPVARFLDRRWKPWGRPALVVLLVAGGLFTLPLCVPLLSPGATAEYLAASHLQPNTGEDSGGSALPQYFADRFGWREQVDAVGRIYESLPPEDRSVFVIYCGNYGEAGAVDYFGDAYGLPAPHCGQNNYYFWWATAPPGEPGAAGGPATIGGRPYGDVAVTYNFSEESLESMYEHFELVAVVDLPFAMPYETPLRIHLCRGLKHPLAMMQPFFKVFV